MKKFKIWKVFLSIAIVLVCVPVVIALVPWTKYKKLDDYRGYFAKNQQELTRYASDFLRQSSLTCVFRVRQFTKIHYGVYCKSDDHNGFDAYMSFMVPYNEARFWERTDIKEIRGDPAASDEETMGDYFEKYGISDEEFLKWRAFLSKYDLYSISMPKGASYVELEITPDTSFRYYREDIDVRSGGPSEHQSTINEHWTYYDRHGETIAAD